MATIERRIDSQGKVTYRAKVRKQGQRPLSETFSKHQHALLWAARTEEEMKSGRYAKRVEGERHTCDEMIDRYLRTVMPQKPRSARSQTTHLNWWKRQIGDVRLADVTPALIAECRDELLVGRTARNALRTGATVNRYLAAISHVLTNASKEWGWIEESPMRNVRKLKEPRGRLRFLSDAEREKLLAACKASENKFLLTIVVLALSTGMRHGEIMWLRWDDIDFARQRITLLNTKNNDIRVLPLADLALELLTALHQSRSTTATLLFPSALQRAEQRPVEIMKAWSTAISRAGIKNFRFHDLRHSCASYLAMNGATVVELSSLLGHRTLQMVKRYAHLSDAHTTTIVTKMNKAIFAEITLPDKETK